MSSRDTPPAALAAARKMAGDKAQPALELVGYDGDLSAAMKYAFGGSFVCKVRAALQQRSGSKSKEVAAKMCAKMWVCACWWWRREPWRQGASCRVEAMPGTLRCAAP